MPNIGDVWRHSSYYVDKDTGKSLPKYLLVLSVRTDGDIVYRLLTSRQNGRPRSPVCYHGTPYPGYYLGIPMPSGLLDSETWLDLREISEDFDSHQFEKLRGDKILTLVHKFSPEVMCPLLYCTAYAEDTTRRQTKDIMISRQILNCG